VDISSKVSELELERDELRAEVATIKTQLAELEQGLNAENRQLLASNSVLRGENERLTLADRQWADHVKRLSEEKERLLVELTHRVGWQERSERAEAELERLREIAWKHGNRADEAEVKIEQLERELAFAKGGIVPPPF
jgi:chromosome segregation ATPase